MRLLIHVAYLLLISGPIQAATTQDSSGIEDLGERQNWAFTAISAVISFVARSRGCFRRKSSGRPFLQDFFV